MWSWACPWELGVPHTGRLALALGCTEGGPLPCASQTLGGPVGFTWSGPPRPQHPAWAGAPEPCTGRGFPQAWSPGRARGTQRQPGLTGVTAGKVCLLGLGAQSPAPLGNPPLREATPQVRGAVGGAQGPWQLLTPPRGVTYRPGPPRAVWRPGFLHGHHKATLPTPHKERGATPTGVFAAWGLGSAKWPCGLVAASFRKQLSRCCPPFRSVVLLPGAPVLPAPTRSGLESGGRGEGSVPSAACADGPSVSLRSLCRVRAVPAGPTGLSRGLWAASPGGPAAPAGPAGLPGGLGSAHCPCAGAERGRGRAHVSHHHPDPGGPGEVQGPSHHRPNRQRLRQHRHQVSRGLG